MTADALRERIARALFLEEFPSSADAWDAPGESGRVRYRRRADAVLAVLADADPTDLSLETSGVWYCRRHSGIANEDQHRGLCPWWDHADHCDAEHDEDLDDGACSPCQWVELLIPPARPRTEEAHTVDVGHVHVRTTPGGPCAPTCPHPHHRTEETPDAG